MPAQSQPRPILPQSEKNGLVGCENSELPSAPFGARTGTLALNTTRQRTGTLRRVVRVSDDPPEKRCRDSHFRPRGSPVARRYATPHQPDRVSSSPRGLNPTARDLVAHLYNLWLRRSLAHGCDSWPHSVSLRRHRGARLGAVLPVPLARCRPSAPPPRHSLPELPRPAVARDGDQSREQRLGARGAADRRARRPRSDHRSDSEDERRGRGPGGRPLRRGLPARVEEDRRAGDVLRLHRGHYVPGGSRREPFPVPDAEGVSRRARLPTPARHALRALPRHLPPAADDPRDGTADAVPRPRRDGRRRPERRGCDPHAATPPDGEDRQSDDRRPHAPPALRRHACPGRRQRWEGRGRDRSRRN